MILHKFRRFLSEIEVQPVEIKKNKEKYRKYILVILSSIPFLAHFEAFRI